MGDSHLMPLFERQRLREFVARQDEHLIWRLDPEARAFVQEQTPEEKRDCRLFFTGVNLFFYNVNSRPPSFEIISRLWEDQQDRKFYLDYTLQYTNPFHQFLRQVDLYDYDINEEEDSMGLYLLGRRLTDLDEDITIEKATQELDSYEDRDDLFNTMVNFAEEILDELSPEELLPFRRPHESNARAHITSGGEGYSPPTWGDLTHITENLEKLNMRRRWVFEETLCQQGNGSEADYPKRRIVHLFCAITEDGILEKRIVTKIEGYYNYEDAVDGDVEFDVHKDLTAIESPYILACHGSSIRGRIPTAPTPSPTHLLYGYLEYAPHCDLYDLMISARIDRVFIPEFFIWRVFRSLAVALFNLDMGTNNTTINGNTLARSNDNLRRHRKEDTWRSIVNLDIKAANVVLGDPSNDYPAFPVPKMMDFGICLRHDENTEVRYEIDHDEALNGTEGWRPPEQLQLSGQLPGETYDDAIGTTISVHSHIFNVGLIVLGLMNRGSRPYSWYDNHAPTHRIDYDHMYSARLDNLAQRCVKLVPMERPTLVQLLHETKQGELSARARCIPDPYRREKYELEPGLQFTWPRSRENDIGDDMGDVFRYAMRRGREGEEPEWDGGFLPYDDDEVRMGQGGGL